MEHHHHNDGGVAAALEAIRAQHERLARGDARPHDNVPAVSTAAPPVADEQRRVPTPARPGAKRRRRLVWVSARVQRWRADGTVLEDVGALEFLRGAALADVRTLVDQFYPLPHRRGYDFYHPVLRTRIDQRDEATIDPSGWGVLGLVAVPPRAEPQVGPHVAEIRTEIPYAKDVPPPASTDARRPVETQHTDSPKVRAARETGSSAAPAEIGRAACEVVFQDREIRGGIKCDLVVREFDTAVLALQVRALSGKYEGKSTDFKRFQLRDTGRKHDDRTLSALLTNFEQQLGETCEKLEICDNESATKIKWKLIKLGAPHKDQLHGPSAVTAHGPRTQDTAVVPPLPTMSAGQTRLNADTILHAHDNIAGRKRAHQERSHVDRGGDQSTKKPWLRQMHHNNSLASTRGADLVVDQTTPRDPAIRNDFVPPKIIADTTPSQCVLDRIDLEDDSGARSDEAAAVCMEKEPDVKLFSLQDASPATVREQRYDATSTERPGGQVPGSTLPEPDSTLTMLSDLRGLHGETEADDQEQLDAHGTTRWDSERDQPEESRVGGETADLLVDMQPIVPTTQLAEPVLLMDVQDSIASADKLVETRYIEPLIADIISDTFEKMKTISGAGSRKNLADLKPVMDARLVECATRYATTFLNSLVKLHEDAKNADTLSIIRNDSDHVETNVLVEQPALSSSVLISLAQFQSAFQHYGIDHAVMALNGAILALEDGLFAWSGDHLEIADLAIENYVRDALAQVGHDPNLGQDRYHGLQRFETILNFAANFLEWDKPTRVRMEVIETCTSSNFETLSDLAQRRGFRLSDNERSLLSRIISGLTTDASLELEKWLTDVFEVVYFLLYRSFVTSDKEKVSYIMSREQRIKWVIQRMISLESGAWRRLQLKCHSLEDKISWEILCDRITAFKKKRQIQSKLLDTDVFVNAFVTLVSSKAAQIEQSLTSEIAHSAQEVATMMQQRFVVLMKAELDAKSWNMSDTSVLLRDLGLKVCNLDSINKERRARGLSSVHLSGSFSIRTHHQTRLLGSAYGMHKKARWNLPDMAPWPDRNWFVFQGDSSIAFEYVYVRYGLDLQTIGARWEDTFEFVQAEARKAFRFTYGNLPLSSTQRMHVLCGVGLNALHVGSLRNMVGIDTLAAMATTYPRAESISIGFYVSKNDDFASIRITFRVHASETLPPKSSEDTFDPTDSVMSAIDRFLCVADETLLQEFVHFGGVSFLYDCLVENRDRDWANVPFGGFFHSIIKENSLQVVYPRRRVLFFIRSLLGLIAKSERTITESNLSLLDGLISLHGIDGEDLVVNAASHTFAKLAGLNGHFDRLPGKTHELQDPQKKFLVLHGLDRLKNAIDTVSSTIDLRHVLEDGLFYLLTARVLCSQEAFLVHAPLWVEYFVEPQVWTTSPGLVDVLREVLDEIHKSFFVEPFHPRGRVTCGCGCQGFAIATFAGLEHVMKLFCYLIKTDVGSVWGLHNMNGPMDLLAYLHWTRELPSSSSVNHTTQLVSTSTLTPKLLNFVIHEYPRRAQTACIEVIGYIIHSLIKLKLWESLPIEALECILGLPSAVAETSSACAFSNLACQVIFHQDETMIKTDSQLASLVHLMCLEHEKTLSGHCDVLSIFQSTMVLLRCQTQADGLERLWRVPLLIFLCTVISDLNAMRLFSDLGIEQQLIRLLQHGATIEEAILARRALTVFYVQALRLPTWQACIRPLYADLFKTTSTTLRNGARMSFTHNQIESHYCTDESLLFGSETRDAVELLSSYKAIALKLHRISPDELGQIITNGLSDAWSRHPWHELTSLETLFGQLQLLLAYSSIASIILLEDFRDEVVQILRYLLIFVRDRTHVPEVQVLLYVSAMTNIVIALGHQFQNTNLTAYVDTKFCERLFVYSRRPTSLLSYLSSKALSVCLMACGDRDFMVKNLRLPLQIVDEIHPTQQNSLSARNGLDHLVSNIALKLSAKKSIEGDAAALGFVLEHDSKSAPLFFNHHGYSTATKYLDDFRHIFRTGLRSRTFTTPPRRPTPVATLFGYDLHVTGVEKDMVQLLYFAHSCLNVLARMEDSRRATDAPSDAVFMFSSLDDEISRTKRTIVPLLNDHHPLIVNGAVQCILVHLTNHPPSASRLLSPENVDHIMALSLEPQLFADLQWKALVAVRAIVGGIDTTDNPYQLLEKLFRNQERIVQCLKSDNFNVTKQAVELMALMLSKNDEVTRRTAFAALFQQEENQVALSQAFVLLCKESAQEEEAAGVLQRIVGVVIQLDLVQFIDSEVLVEALTLTLSSHKHQLFLRPLVCKCLWEVAIQPQKAVHFAKRSRLNAIVSLLNESLTNGEAQHVGAILRATASGHIGIRRYLSELDSACLGGVAKVLGSFSRISVGGFGVDQPSISDEFDDAEGYMETEGRRVSLPSYDGDARHAIRLSFDTQVLISSFTDEVYEEFLQLLIILLGPYEFAEERYGCLCRRGCKECDACDLFARARGPRAVIRFLYARRVVVHMTDTNQRMMEAQGSDAYTLIYLALRILQMLSRNHQSRIDTLIESDSRSGWWSVRWLMDRSKPSMAKRVSAAADASVNALMTISQLCAEEAVMAFVSTQRDFLLHIFTHVLTLRNDDEALRCQRAATFLLARLAEHPKVTRDLLFQEKISPMFAELDRFEDPIVLANVLTVARNLRNYRYRQDVLESVIHALEKERNHQRPDHAMASLLNDVLVTNLLSDQKADTSTTLSVQSQTRTCIDAAHKLISPLGRTPPTAWSRLVLSFADDDDLLGFNIRVPQLDYVIAKLWPTARRVEKLLEFLLTHHLYDPNHSSNAVAPASASDDILDDTSPVHARVQVASLQYVAKTSEQNAATGNDSSFAGSEHLWRFVQLIWRLCEKDRHLRNDLAYDPLLDLVVHRFGGWLSRAETSSVVSASALARRQRLLSFVNEILRNHPQMCKLLSMRDIVTLVEGFVTQSGSAHGAYEMLCIMCRADDANAAYLIKHTGLSIHPGSRAVSEPNQGERTSSHIRPALRLLWSPSRPQYFERAIPLTRIVEKGRPSGAVMHVLEPFVPPTSTTTAFSIALLDLVSAILPEVLVQFLDCQSIFVLLDILLLSIDTNDPRKRTQHTLNASVLSILRKCLKAEPNTVRHFAADPRLLQAVVYHTFSVKVPTQVAAVRLLLELMQTDPTVPDRLKRLEDGETSVSQVHGWMIDATETRLGRLRVASLKRKELVEVTHLVQVPLFASVKTSDIARLSVAFMESRLIERDHFMVLAGIGHFSTAPEWMSGGEAHGGKALFDATIEKMKATATPILVYKMPKEWYTGGSSIGCRSSIAKTIQVERERLADAADHPTWLMNRLSRFLVEDRAEILRRVSYRRGTSQVEITSKLSDRWTDIMGLLAELAVLRDVSRDSLACLAVAIGESTIRSFTQLEQDNGGVLPLVLVLSECANYHVQVVSKVSNASLAAHGCLRRGDLFGFTPWLRPEPEEQQEWQSYTKSVITAPCLLAVPLPDELLRMHFLPAEYERFMVRCKDAVPEKTSDGLTRWLETIRTRVGPSYSSRHATRLDLQLNSLRVIEQLLRQSKEYANSIIRNTRIMSILSQVARSYLDPALVDASFETITAAVAHICDGREAAVLQQIVIEIVQDSVATNRDLSKPFRLLRRAADANIKWEHRLVASLLRLLPEALENLINQERPLDMPFTREIIRLTYLLTSVAPNEMKTSPESRLLYIHVVHLLINHGRSVDFTTLDAFLGLVVFFDKDPTCQESVHVHMLKAGMWNVLRLICINLSVWTRLNAVNAAHFSNQLRFITVFANHIVIDRNMNESRLLGDPQTNVPTEMTRNLLECYNCSDINILLDALATSIEAFPQCASIAGSSRVRVGNRIIHFHRHVFQLFRALLSSKTGSVVPNSVDAAVMTRCIAALSSTQRCMNHFTRHGFVEIAFRYLSDWPPEEVLAAQAEVWTPLLTTLKIMVESSAITSTNLLRTYEVELRNFHSRAQLAISTTAMNDDEHRHLRRALAMLFNLITSLQDQAVASGDRLGDHIWLVTEVVQQSLRWIEPCVSDHPQWKYLHFDDSLCLASLRCVASACGSSILVKLCFDLAGFPDALHRLCDGILDASTGLRHLEGYVHCLCIVADHVVHGGTVLPDWVSSVFVSRVLPSTVQMMSGSSPSRFTGSQVLEYALRLIWLILDMVSSVYPTSAARLEVDLSLVLIKAIGGLLNDFVPERVHVNAVGCLSVVIAFATVGETAVLVVSTVRHVLTLYHSKPHREFDILRHKQALSGDIFAVRHWSDQKDLDILRLEILLAKILHQMMVHPAIASAWLVTDPDLRQLYTLGLNFALCTISLREPSIPCIASEQTDCLSFIRESIALLTARLSPNAAAVWRRAARKSGLLSTMARKLQLQSSPRFLKHEIVRCLHSLVMDSVVDCVEIVHVFERSRVNIFLDVVVLAMSPSEGAPPTLTSDCLELIATTSSMVESVAQLAVSAMGAPETFVTSVISMMANKTSPVCPLSALFRCCRSAYHLLTLRDGSVLWDPVIGAMRISCESDDCVHVVEGVRLLRFLASRCANHSTVGPSRFPEASFWRMIHKAIRTAVDSSVRDKMVDLCCTLAFNKSNGLRLHEEHDTVTISVIEAIITECIPSASMFDVAFCAEWLSYFQAPRLSLSRHLCAQLADFASLPLAHQLALIEIFPALTSALSRGQRLGWITTAIWLTLRDHSLLWYNNDDKRRRRCALIIVQSLLWAKRVRMMHDAASTFRRMCASWTDRYVRGSASQDDVEETALGMTVLVRVSAILGFNIDLDSIVTRAMVNWRENAVSTELAYAHPELSALGAVVMTGLDGAGDVRTALAGEMTAEDGAGGMRLLVSSIAGSLCSPLNHSDNLSGHHLALALLRSSTISSVMRGLLHNQMYDLLDSVAWALHRFDADDWDGHVATACEMLSIACVDSRLAQRVINRRIIDRWVEAIAYRRGDTDRKRAHTDLAFQLLSTVVMRHNIHRCQRVFWKPLIHHTVMHIVQDRIDQDRLEPRLLELLCYLIQQGGDTLQELWRVCLLTAPTTRGTTPLAQRTILRSLTDALRDAASPEDRRRAAFIVFSLSASLRRATPLIQARQSCDDSMCDLVTKALAFSTGTRQRHAIRVDPTDWSTSSAMFPLLLNFVASDTAVWVLRVLQKCLRDKGFTRGLWGESNLFDQVFASLACPNVDISSAAALALRDAILPHATQRRIAGARDQLLMRSYRLLAYFEELRAHDHVFSLVPHTAEAAVLPRTFAVLELWVRFYAHRVDTLDATRDARDHIEAVLEVALFVLTQHGPQLISVEGNAAHQRALRDRLTNLCGALLEIACGPPTESLSRVRVLTLELLAALSTMEASHSSIDLFRRDGQVGRVLLILETARSVLERVAALQLMRELASIGAVKLLFGSASSRLLQRLVKWLQEPELVGLQPFATAILKQVVTRSLATTADAEHGLSRRQAIQKQQQTLTAIAEALFTDGPSPRDDESVSVGVEDGEKDVVHVATVTASLDVPSTVSTATVLPGPTKASVILHFRLLARTGKCLREFRYRGKLRASHRSLGHSIVLEPSADVLCCDVVLVAPRETAASAKPAVHQLKLKLTPRDRPRRVDAFVPDTIDGVPIVVSAECTAVASATPQGRGVLGRLLSRSDLLPGVVSDAVAIVAELSKNQEVFSNRSVGLSRHILAVMEATRRLGTSVDVAPLNALTTWFWGSRSSVAHFRSSWDPLLHLIQWVRASSLMDAPPHTADRTEVRTHSGPTFLASLMEWLATLESESLTENCVNVLFFENADALLALAPLFYPNRSPHATFFFLVATVVRTNCLHCEIFARRHAVQMLRAMLDVAAAPSSETLQHAARVVAKIARAGPAADKFLRHDGMALFGRIAFLVCWDEDAASWDHARLAAADNLVLASAFLCEAHSWTTLDRFTYHHDPANPRQISLVETLLLYLAAQERRRRLPHTLHSSLERLAARILRAWIENWPADTASFEAKLAAAVETTSRERVADADPAALAELYATGLRRCLELTRWDFFSELYTIRTAYSATVSAGVRTGVVPLVVRNAFACFDHNYLKDPSVSPDVPSRAASQKLLSPEAQRDGGIAHELQLVLQLVGDHELRVQTLASNRKRHLVDRLRTADSSARVATAFHAVLAVVHDAFVDALAGAATPPSASTDVADANRVVLAWLALLEQLLGLLCCALEELDPTYYGEVFRQLHVLLVSELPGFLVKTERSMRREEAARTVLTNLERLLKRLLSKQELRGVTAETEDVAQPAERLLAQFSQMKPSVSKAFALALSARGSLERLQRGIVAAEYAWRRVVGDDGSITAFMAGTAEPESLWSKLRSSADAFAAVVRHPGPLLLARWRRLQSLLVALVATADSDGSRESMIGRVSVRGGDDATESDALGDEARLAAALGIQAPQLLESRAPFIALESLLDNYGFASIGVKKQIALLNFTELRGRVVEAFARALGVAVAAVETLSASELERALTTLHSVAMREAVSTRPRPQAAGPGGGSRGSKAHLLSSTPVERHPGGDVGATARLRRLLHELAVLVDESDLGVQLRVTVPRAHAVSLWQLLLAPVRRARLFAAYSRMATWDSSASGTNQAGDTAVGVPPHVEDSVVVKSSVLEPSAQSRSRRRIVAAAPEALSGGGGDPFTMLQSKTIASVVDAPWHDDPLSEESLVAAVRRTLRERHPRPPPRRWLARLWPASRRYAASSTASWRDRARRRLALALLLLAFWRQEELERDLTNAVLARAFASAGERQDYFLALHLRKALAELVRVWMPESGSLGLPLWHSRGYFVGGSLLCVALAVVVPRLLDAAGSTPAARNAAMTGATYALVLAVFAGAAVSMHAIATKHFDVQQRRRLRLVPLAKYYQNALALAAVAVEIVQLNSISFDPQFNYNATDQIPKLIRWLGALGIAQISVEQVELKAALCGATLLGWLVTLKCANKFQETSAAFNRLVTKDLPALLHGTLYMGLLSTFFSFLACVDCTASDAPALVKCKASDPPAPFLLSHQNVPCWTRTHAPYALLGLAGVAFFLPVGLLAQGMNQVLFAHEALDVRFAPVVTLFGQLVKALAAAARAFFPFRTTLLAGVALAGNALLLALMLAAGRGGASRWYLGHVKSAVYAASGWAAACAIYRVERAAAASVATNVVYMGWLAIGGAAAVAVRVGMQRRDDNDDDDNDDDNDDDHDDGVAMPPGSLHATDHVLGEVEHRFLRDAAVRGDHATRTPETRALLQRAAVFADEDPPAELRTFMRRARAYAATNGDAHETAYLQNARRLARLVDRAGVGKQLKTA